MNHQSGTTTRRSHPLVCHLSSVHWVDDPRIFHKQCRTLAAAGYEVVLLAVEEGGRFREESRAGVRVVSLPRVRRYFPRWFRVCPKLYRAAKARRAAVYHVHDPELIPWALLLRLRTGAKIVYDMHEYYSEVLYSRLDLPLLRPLIRWVCRVVLEWLPCRFFDAVVFPTDALRLEFPGTQRATTIRNFPHEFPHADASPSHPDQTDGQYDVVFVGAVSAPRMRFMLEIAQRLAARRPRFRWLFVGLSEAMIDWIRETYDAEFVESHLDLRTRVSFEEVLRLCSRSRIGFNYHPREKRFLVAIPMKVFEYMSVGLPVVSTALPELIALLGTDDRHAVLLDSDGPEDYANAIDSLLGDVQRAARIGLAGQALARQDLSWQVHEAPKLRKLYAELVEGTRES